MRVADGENYYQFLVLLRSLLPAAKTISICAPAGFYNLQAYPIAKIAATIDWIVYMTYDLHGQWDYGSPYAE
jgi:chitinase